MGIGCEACHGPGRPHVELMEAWEKNPASKPAYDNSAKNRELNGLLKIFSPRSAGAAPDLRHLRLLSRQQAERLPRLPRRRSLRGLRAAVPHQRADSRQRSPGRVLARRTAQPVQSPAGADAERMLQGRPGRCARAVTSRTARANPFSLKVNITQGRNGDLLCTQCHARCHQRAHRCDGRCTGAPVRSVATLTGTCTCTCGTDCARASTDAAIERHTFHKAASAGSRCISCHMSDVNWRLLIRRRDHTFQPPVPEMTAAFGVPNACTTCHDDRTPEWAASQMDHWWGDGERRKAAMRARRHDVSRRFRRCERAAGAGAPRRRSHRRASLVRASAVEFMEQLALGTAGTEAADVQSQTSFGDARQAVGAAQASRRTQAWPPVDVDAATGERA